MKQFLKRRMVAIGWLLIIVVFCAFQNGGTPAVSTPFDYWFFAPFGVGLITHFLKKYLETKNSGTPVNFVNWYVQNAGWTITSLSVGVAVLYGALNGMALNPQTCLIAFNTGFAADSLNQGGTTTPKAP